METIARLRKVHSSAQKIRLLANIIRGKKVDEALNILTYNKKKAATIVKKLIASAIANANHNNGIDINQLKISKFLVDNASTVKRLMPRAKGRADRILKRTSHITIVVSDNSGD
ncbi:MAG: 50S ribosomal protein L22 [Candidatus Dasytiphilus stammeri]